jgi:hypothetical protein
MADETVDIDVNINANTGEAEGSFTRLQTQIRETTRLLQAAEAAGNQAAFNQYKKTLDELEDKLEITTLKQKQFDDTLAAAPGPLGKAGQAVKAFDGALKFLAANPIVAIIAGLAAVLFAVKEAMEKTAGGTKALSQMTEAFGNILTPIIEFISAVAVPVVGFFADAVNGLAVALGLVNAEQVEAQAQYRQYAIDVKKANAELQGQIDILEAKGDKEADIAGRAKQIIDNEIALLEQKRAALGKLTAEEEAQIVSLQNKKEVIDVKEQARLKKVAEDNRKKKQEEYNKDIEDLQKALKYNLDTYDEFYTNEKFALDKQKAEGLVTETKYQEELFRLNKDKNDNAIKEQDKYINRYNQILDDGFKKGYYKEEEYNTLRLNAATENAKAVADVTKTGLEQEISYIDKAAQALKDLQTTQIEINNNIAQSWIDLGSTIGGTFATLANIFEEGSAAQKAFAIASVVINGAAAVGKILLDAKENISSANKVIAQGVAAKAQGAAIAPLNPVIGGLLIGAGTAAAATGGGLLAKAKASAGFQLAAVAATSGAQIAAILSAGNSKSTGGGGGVGGSGGGGSISVSTPTIGAPQIGPTSTQQGTIAGIVAGTLQANNSVQRPIQAYVVGDQVTSQQQLDRRVSLAARLGG